MQSKGEGSRGWGRACRAILLVVPLATLAGCDESLIEALSPTQCSGYRWQVKTASDPGAIGVDATVQSTTIADIAAIRGVAREDTATRHEPFETTIWRLDDVKLIGYFLSDDLDAHLILSDGYRKMIAEIPSEKCLQRAPGPFVSQIQSARAALELRFELSLVPKPASTVVSIKGLGFFDYGHDQGGLGNWAELHPVTGICFEPGCTP